MLVKLICDMDQYQELAIKTAKDMGSKAQNLNHAALGVSGEAGEFCDAVKKYTIYGKPLDVQNVVEELGDILWFVALACDTLHLNMSDVARHNIEKLQRRYPDKYTDAAAIARADKEAAVFSASISGIANMNGG